MKKGLSRIIFEFLSIVVAVVLAMGLTEWRQDYLNRQLAEKSFQNIVAEISENLESLRSDSVRIARDREFMTKWVRDWVSEGAPGPFEAGFRLSILSTAAWEVAKVNQSLTHLSNERNMAMAEIYALQDFYTVKASAVFDLMGSLQGVARDQTSEEFFQVVQKLRYHMNLVFNTVPAYIDGCEDFLEEYGHAPSEPSEESD